jgi:hypothetical protein
MMANKYEKYSLKQNPNRKRPGRYSGHKLYYSCIKKKKYEGDKQVEKKISEIYNERGVKLKSYTCDFCGHYHLTSKGA